MTIENIDTRLKRLGCKIEENRIHVVLDER